MIKRLAKINTDYCAACGACTHICPRNAISIHKGCYAIVDTSLCVGCGMCSKTCPGQAITIETQAGGAL